MDIHQDIHEVVNKINEIHVFELWIETIIEFIRPLSHYCLSISTHGGEGHLH